MAKKKHEKETGIENVEHALTSFEQFIEDNQKIILIVVGSILFVVAAYMMFMRLYLGPLQEEASSQMFVAEQYFEIDSFNLALNGDGNYLGFLDIIDEYGITKAANLAKYYAGISYLHLNNFDEAIAYLEEFKPKDKLVGAISYGALGDAWVELNDLDQAVEYYEEAVAYNNNDFTAPIYLLKTGQCYEEMGEFEKAIKAYDQIEKEYPESAEAQKAKTYQARAKFKMEE